MQLRSHAHIKVVINGHVFVSWSDDDPPYDFESEDAAELKRGQDGGLWGLGMPSFGAVFKFMMQPTSPTAQWAVQQEQIRKNAHKAGDSLRIYTGTITDTSVNISFSMSGGVIMKFPPVVIANKTYEGTIEFEEITSNVDGGVFSPSFAT